MLEENTVVATKNEDEVQPIDARVRIFLSQDLMKAEAEVSPPQNGGADVTMEKIKEALEKSGVVFGVDEDALDELTIPLYNKRMVVAEGEAAQDGQDGVCTECFSREIETHYNERADGSMDYKELGLIRDVKKGTVICEITPPIMGVNGTNVKGKTLKARSGTRATIPIGENIELNEDQTKAVAKIEGNVVFRSNHFLIETIYRVQNVDYEVGNIHFSGDVDVSGDVHDGFEIHAGGKVVLHGQIGAAIIKAKDIIIDSGINGTGKAVLESQGDIKAGFIENCQVYLQGDLKSGSIVNSKVECGGNVEVTSDKGIICGGSVVAFSSVKAKVIGNESNTHTAIILGFTPQLIEDKKNLVDQLDRINTHIEELNKNTAYIQKLVDDGRPVPEDRLKMLKRAQIQVPMSEKKKEQLEKKILELENKMDEGSGATLTADIIYPPTKVTIGRVSDILHETRNHCRVYKNKDGDVTFGTA